MGEPRAASAGAPESATPCGKSAFAHVTDGNVDEGARRLAAVGDESENTRRAYQSALRRLDAWLNERRRGRTLDDVGLAEYLGVLDAEGRCASSAAQAVAAVKWRARQRGEASLAGEATAEALRRYRRAARDGRGQVRGISWTEADRMVSLATSAGDARGLRDAALVAVASDALLRVSEVANVQVEDITFESDGTGRLLVRRSKTDRRGRGAVLFLGSRTATLVRDWAASAEVKQGALGRAWTKPAPLAARGFPACFPLCCYGVSP